MEKFNGKWELVPESYENLEGFSEKMEVPKEQQEALKNLVMISTIKIEENKLHLVTEYKGLTMKQELTFTEGEPLDYKGYEGSQMTTEYTSKGDRLYEKHKAVTAGTTREWTVERYIEGDMQVAGVFAMVSTIQELEGEWFSYCLDIQKGRCLDDLQDEEGIDQDLFS